MFLTKGFISTDYTFGNTNYNSEKNLTDHLTVIMELRLKRSIFSGNLKAIARASGEPRQINEDKNYLNKLLPMIFRPNNDY